MTVGKRLISKVTDSALAYKALSHPYRLAILALLENQSMTEAEIGKSLGIAANLTAHHLGILKLSGWVERSVRIGRIITYSISSKPIKELKLKIPFNLHY
jgi:DNA-binding transcriptional ArsR family regulator